MNLWHAIILGLVEGITEYLPISSTGHLILASALLGLDSPPETKQAVDAFNVIVQGGGILAVLGLYRQRVMQMLRGLVGKDASGRRLLLNLVIAFLPAALAGPLLDDWISARLFRPVPVLVALFVGGLAMLVLGPWQRRFFHEAAREDETDAHTWVDIEHLTWRRALIVGLLQCVAMWPGTSRSMMTIIGGMLVGLKPKHAAEFSFLLGLPTLGGACVYKLGKDFLRDGSSVFDILGAAQVLVGIVVAAIAAAVAIRWLVSYLTRHGVAVFGWYRIVLCLVMAVLWKLGIVTW